MNLSTQHLLAPELSQAAAEALDNATLLYVGGYFAPALEIATALLGPGPWQINPHGSLTQRLKHLLPLLCWANRVACPAVGEEPARNNEQLALYVEEQCQHNLSIKTSADRLQQGKAGQDWNEAWFAALPVHLAATENGIYRNFGKFIGELEFVLKLRLREKLAIEAPDLFPDFLKPFLPMSFHTMQDIAVADHVQSFHHDRLADILEQCRPHINNGLCYQEENCWLLILMLDLADGDTRAAQRHAQRALAGGLKPDPLLMFWPPMCDFLAGHPLAAPLGLSDAEVSAYLAAFHGRNATTLRPTPAAADFDWGTALADYAEAHDAEVANDDCWCEPESPALIALQQAGRVRGAGASDAVIAALEQRLDTRLPPSYVAFLRHSDGLLIPHGMVNLLPAAEVDWFATLDPQYVESWTREEVESEIEDERYFIYGPDQDSVWTRNHYLKTALQVSDSHDGDVILLNPMVRFGEEWEAWYFGYKLPGAHRYRSFAELMDAHVFHNFFG